MYDRIVWGGDKLKVIREGVMIVLHGGLKCAYESDSLCQNRGVKGLSI